MDRCIIVWCRLATFYTIAVYFGAVGVTRTRYALPAALCADLTGFLAAAWAVRLCFGG